jgi:hypothetical protein
MPPAVRFGNINRLAIGKPGKQIFTTALPVQNS